MLTLNSAKGLVGIFPLMVLAQRGKRREVVEEAISGIETAGGKSTPELLSATYILASLVFKTEADQTWLRRRFHPMRKNLRTTSWAYEEIVQEGREEERQQRLKDQRQVLMTIVQVHFPNIADLAKQQAEDTNDPEQLQSLCIKLLTTQTEEQARQILLETKGNAS